MKQKAGSLKVNKTHKCLAKLIKRKREKTQNNRITEGIGYVNINNNEIQRIIRE
jgi:hypothetical protein